MNKISLAEKEKQLQVAGKVITQLMSEMPFINYFSPADGNYSLQEFVSKLILHSDEFMQEVEKILKNTTRTEFENQKEEFLKSLSPAIADEVRTDDLLIGGLFLHSKIKTYTNALDILALLSNDKEIKDTTDGKMLKKSTNIFKKYIDAMIALIILEWYAKSEQEEEKRPEIRTGGKKPDTILFPTDKINSVLYSGLDKGSHPIGVEKSGSKEKITTYLTIDFDALENSTGITFKKLTPFDKRVYIAAGALLQAGNKYFSATQLYRAMGGTGSPAPNQIKNIVDSCRIMMGYRILIDNHQEAADYNYSEFQRELLFMFPVEIRENISINGRTVKICFEFLKDELPLLKFARERKHTETYTLEQWTLPFSMTDEHILLDDYFRRNIHRLNGKKGKKETYTGNLTYTTIYEKYGIDTKKRPDAKVRQKISRLSKKGGDIETLLNHYQKTGMIQDYKMHKNEITITL